MVCAQEGSPNRAEQSPRPQPRPPKSLRVGASGLDTSSDVPSNLKTREDTNRSQRVGLSQKACWEHTATEGQRRPSLKRGWNICTQGATALQGGGGWDVSAKGAGGLGGTVQDYSREVEEPVLDQE